MATKTPSEVAQDYLDELKGLKPELNTDQDDSDWWIRSRVVGSVAAGVYADQRLISNDAFPQKARREAIQRHLEFYLERDFLPATNAQGFVKLTGTPGTTIPAGLLGEYTPNGNTYSSQETIELDAIAGTGLASFQSVATGQDQNLNPYAELTFSTPPSGLDQTGEVASGGISDGRNEESLTEAREAVLTFVRSRLSVGKKTDYEQYARNASASVTSTTAVRYHYGPGTVGIYITSGTTDIDSAIDSDQAISLIPSDELVEEVQAFIEENQIFTDCVTILKPTEKSIDVTVRVKFLTGDSSTVPSGQTLTQSELVQREVRRAIYKTPIGGRKLGGVVGYVLASEIEQTIDAKLSSESVVTGSIPILSDRQVGNLSVDVNLELKPEEAPTPGTITVVEI